MNDIQDKKKHFFSEFIKKSYFQLNKHDANNKNLKKISFRETGKKFLISQSVPDCGLRNANFSPQY